jgi:hypothetical protein
MDWHLDRLARTVTRKECPTVEGRATPENSAHRDAFWESS